MKVPVAESCCCGCSLRVGTLIIAFLSLILSIGGFVRLFQLYYKIVELSDNTDLDDPDIVEMREHLLGVKISMYGYLLSNLISAILAVVLLVGIFMEKRKMVVSWVFGSLAIQIASFMGAVVYCVVVENFTYLAFNMSVLIYLYFTWVVYSYSKQMGKGSSNIA